MVSLSIFYRKTLKFILCLFFVQNTIAQEISLLFLGDIMGHGPQIKAAWDDSLNSYNYDEVFQPVEQLISSVDFAIANLEVTLAGPPYKGYPQFSSPDDLAVACKKSGIDVLVTANNHSCDRGSNGIIRTVKVLDSLGIQHTGTFKNIQERDSLNLLILEKKGIKVGLLNYTYGTNGIKFSSPTYVNLLDSTLIKKDINNAHKQNLDKLIVFVHWGAEYKDLPNSYQKKYNQFLKDQGVDMVIGAHPHVIQPMLYEKQKANKKEFLTVYSLGNFVSNQRDLRKDGGAMFRCSYKKNKKIKLKDKEFILTWVHKFSKGNKMHYQVLPCAHKEYDQSYFSSQADYKQMQNYITHARSLYKRENEGVPEGRPIPKIHMDKHEPVEIHASVPPKIISKVNFLKEAKTKKRKR